MHGYFDKIQELFAARTPFVAVTLVDAVGSTPQDAGSKMLVTHQGLAFGTVGGGRIEAKALEQAQAMLDSLSAAKTLFVHWNLQTDVKMTCGGTVKLFFESFASKTWNIVVFGAGHISQALVRTLLNLDCHLTCFDTREEWLAKLPDSPALTKTHAADLPAQVPALPTGAFIILMTMGHSTDRPILTEILKRTDFPYIGVIGSNAKRAALKRGILESGIPEEAFAKVHCPLGLKLGSNHPFEIAISIAAQLIQVRDEHLAPIVPGNSLSTIK